MVSGGHAYNYADTLSENTAPAATETAANLFLRHVAPILRSSSEDVLLSSVVVLCWTRLQMTITNDPPTSECGCSTVLQQPVFFGLPTCQASSFVLWTN